MSREGRWPIDVRPEERSVFAALFLHAVLNGIALVFFETPANTLFLVQVGAAALPYVYIVTAIVLVALGLVITRLERRHRRPVVLRGVLGFLLATVLLLTGLTVGLGGPWISGLLMVWKEILWVLLALEFWALAGTLLDLRQGKRLFGPIGGGQILALVVGGAAVPVLAPLLGTEGLLLVSAGALVGAALVLGWVLRTHGEALEAAEEEARDAALGAPRKIQESPYFRLFVVVSGLSVVVAYLVDFLFLDRIQVALVDEARLSQFFGVFFVGYGLLQVVSSFFVVGPLLSRVGVAGALLILPAAEALEAGGIVAAGLAGAVGVGVILAVLTKLTDEVIRTTLESPSQRILYQAFPSSVRFRVQTLVEMGVEPTAVGVSGLVILAFTLTQGASAVGVAVLLAVLAAAWLLLARRLGGEYPRALARTLASHRLSPTPLQWNDPSTLQVVKDALRSSVPQEVIYGLEVLERLDEEELEGALLEVLSHPNPSVRRYALERIEALELEELADAVLNRAEGEEAPAVLAAAGRCLAVLKGTEPVRVQELLRDLRPRVRRETMVGLLRNGSPEALEAAEPLVHEMAGSDDEEERALVARALGAGQGAFRRVLEELFGDEAGVVRSAAAAAAGRVQDARFISLLVDSLRDPEMRESAGESLAGYGEESVEPLVQALESEKLPTGARRRAARILGRIGGKGAEALFHRIGYPEEEVRLELLQALAHTDFVAPDDQEGRVWSQVADELDDAHWTLGALLSVGIPDARDLLAGALEHEVQKNVQRSLSLLALVLPREAILEAATGVGSHSSVLRAQAVELLETLVPREHGDRLLRLLERRRSVTLRSAEEDPRARRKLNELIQRSSDLTSSWARVASIYRIGRIPHADHLDALERALESGEPLVRETALWAVTKVDPPRAARRLTIHAEDPSPRVRRVARALLAELEDETGTDGRRPMLLTVERVVILKSVSVFQDIPEEYLGELAASVQEFRVSEGETVIRKGDAGSEMYVIVDGRMLVHDGDRRIAELGPREVFGELAALDPEVRSASVTALEECHLFRVSQRVLYHLMAERTEVARGIIHVLCQRLRSAVA